jgi:hypothetical protein
LKNANLPPATKASLVLGATTGSVIVKEAVKIVSTSLNQENLPEGHPDSPTQSMASDIFTANSPLESFNIFTLFGLDPSNQVLNLIFCILFLSFIILMFLYFLTLYLINIYLYNKYKDNLELN